MRVPILHQTDLFHPHADPDDHWDLACVFALAGQDKLDLAGLLIDYPPSPRHGDPSMLSIAQLSYLCGRAAPVSVGSPVRYSDFVAQGSPSHATVRDGSAARQGAAFVLAMLDRCAEPLVITIVGSCRDIAIAGALDPELFRRKCRGVYLNAGAGTNDPNLRANLEYNVTLDPPAYKAMFDLPCPVYWMPCFHALRPDSASRFDDGPNGTVYSFQQREILEVLSPRMRQYFHFMFEHSSDPRWLAYLDRPLDRRTLDAYGSLRRNMWCTGGFFHAAGMGVTRDGEAVPLSDPRSREVYSFEPVDVSCGDDGITTWKSDGLSRQRCIFTVHDRERYPAAMTAAMRTLLAAIDRLADGGAR